MRRPERASFFEVDGIGAEWTGTEWIGRRGMERSGTDRRGRDRKGRREEDWPGLERMGRNGRSG